jgi:hypothetical protein
LVTGEDVALEAKGAAGAVDEEELRQLGDVDEDPRTRRRSRLR